MRSIGGFDLVQKIILIITFLFLTACGYKPASLYTKKMLGGKVFTEVEVSLSDPENTVLIKDALNRALYTHLKSHTSRKEEADSSIKIRYKSISFLPLQYNAKGYVVYYQAHIKLDFLFEKGKQKEERSLVGRYEFPIRASAIISNDLRFKAIEKGSMKALDEFISYLSAKGLVLYEK